MKRWIYVFLIIIIGVFLATFISGLGDFHDGTKSAIETGIKQFPVGIFFSEILLAILLGLGIYKWWVKSAMEEKATRSLMGIEVINNFNHGLFDYILVVFLYLSPTLFGLSEETGKMIYGVGTFMLILTLCTNYKLGVLKLIPAPAHGILELILPLLLVLSPWLFDFADSSLEKNYFIILGIAIYIVHLFSDYHEGVKMKSGKL